MSKSKARRENADKIRKQTPHPHGHITSLEEYAKEYEAGQQTKNGK
ncbi:DUF6254 family protein [Paenibacillus doosanensis]|uniref:YfhD family protein n=1 Tax=Paenibacillus konkukensis TaxID=2020716 RepID=A0ABY4RMZ8_9BACL|nr:MULTISPECIES: DUF6254 family protein [Paenibacillus]MCS7462204.1 DUF6254 family protein [Paenibacillus doosanensis]UQZ82933.1 hypothetical protein SK3146_02093 [Paenibacillus konkukensis]